MDLLIAPIATLGGLGIIFAILLSFASRAFHVLVDRKVAEVNSALPGANCGACGFPGCEGLANAIVNDGAAITSCPVGGEPLVEKLAEIMGMDAELDEVYVAHVFCDGNQTNAGEKFEYHGINDCRANINLQGGSKICSYGCVGCGSCMHDCMFDAITMVDKLPVIDKDKCTGCKVCVDTCPRNIIDMVPYSQDFFVNCVSRERGAGVRKACSVGCIGCTLCVKFCPDGFEMDGALAKAKKKKDVDEESLNTAIEKCPTNAIDRE